MLSRSAETLRKPTRQSLVSAILFLLLMAQAFGVAGQSGIKPPPSPTPAVPEKTEPAFVPDRNRDEYQLAVTKGYELTRGQKVDPDQQWKSYTAGFIDELNRIGAQGYRVISLAWSPRLAVLKRADQQYEYSIIPISNHKRIADGDAQFGSEYAAWAQKGFRVADYTVFYDWCWPGQWNENGNWEPVDCTYRAEALLERRKSAASPHGFEIVSAPLTLSKEKIEIGLEERLSNARKRELYPTHMLTRFQLLTQSSIGDVDFIGDEYETEIVSSDVQKRINELAQQGYRLLLRPLSLQAAIMHRKKGTTVPASYIWVSERKLERELPELQRRGLIYRMSYGCAVGTLSQPHMIFEQPSDKDGKQREYKTVGIDLNLSSPSINITSELNRLTKEGFEVRDFFACEMSDKKKSSRARILLERVSSN